MATNFLAIFVLAGTVSKPDTRCIASERAYKKMPYNCLFYSVFEFWHIVDFVPHVVGPNRQPR